VNTPETTARTLAVGGEPAALPAINPYGLRILLGLNALAKPIYHGTVTASEKARRRKAGKAARVARRVTRSRA
jgi:hypothetical protein